MAFEGVKAWGRRIAGARGFGRLVKLCNPRYRNALRLLRERPEGLFQHWSVTWDDRYPSIFAYVREQLAGVGEPRLLSFGCSTGEELFTLRRYFPSARIAGIDINPWNVTMARKRLRRSGERNIRIIQAGSPAGEPDGVFDAIFCMAVFRSGNLNIGDHPRCDHLLRFADFERAVADLDRTLKPGGYLAIVYTNFRFADTAVAAGYVPVFALDRSEQRRDTPLYGPDNRKLPPLPYNDVVFLKRR